MVRRALAALSLCAAVSLPAPAAAQEQERTRKPGQPEVKVILDRSTVSLNETFKLRFTTEAGNLSEPDWSPLEKDFHLRSRSRSRVRSGARDVHEWSVHLQPKRAGRLRIPPLRFGALRSGDAQLTVKSPKPAGKKKPTEEFFIEVSAKPEDPYVQAQVLFTLRVFMLRNLRGSVTPPQSNNRMVVESLGDARRYRSQRGGRNYEVYERRYLIYPQSSGNIKIKPVRVTGTYTRKGKRHRLNKPSRELSLKVRQVPASFPGKVWLPAESFKISESWSAEPSQWRAGEPVTRMLDLEAGGLLARQVPEVDLSVSEGFRFYTEAADFKDKRHKNTNVGRRRQSVVLIPARSGSYTLPAVRLPWWNTRADRLEIAELPARDLSISEAAFSALTVDEPPPAPGTGEAERRSAASGIAFGTGSPWFWVSVVLLFGWLATAAAAWRGRGLHRLVRAAFRHGQALRASRGAIERACRNNDAAAARDALTQWARQLWPDDTPTSLGKIGARLSDEGDSVAGRQVSKLERVLYARDDKWEGRLLWDALRETFSSRRRKRRVRARAGGLEPLHRL